MKKLLLLIIVLAILSSCASYKKYSYEPIESMASLNGVYFDSTGHIAQSLNFYGSDSIDIFKFEFVDNKQLILSGLTSGGFKLLKTYKGKFNKQENYFQITLSKVYAPFLAVHIMRRDVVRMGKDSSNNLFLDKQYYGYGGMIIFYGGYDYQSSESVMPISDSSLTPTPQNGKWGFAGKNGDMIVNAKYDFVRAFIDDVARVKLNDKWGLINKKGEEIVSPRYDKIRATHNDSLYYIYKGDKYGAIDINGKELVPPVFDYVGYQSNPSPKTYFKVVQGNKQGIYQAGEIIVPVIADDISWSGDYLKIDRSTVNADLLGYYITINKKKYLIDSQKQLYEIKLKEQSAFKNFLNDFFITNPSYYYLGEPISLQEFLKK